MVVGFILPERLPHPTEDLIRSARSRPLQPARNDWDCSLRQKEQMYVIGHNDPSAQFVEKSLFFADFERIRKHARDPLVLEPKRATAAAVERTVDGGKSLPGRETDSGAGQVARQRSPQPPSQEDVFVVGLEMWELSSVFEHSGTGGAGFSLRGGQAKGLPHRLSVACITSSHHL